MGRTISARWIKLYPQNGASLKLSPANIILIRMVYYYVYISYWEKSGKKNSLLQYDLDEEFVRKEIVAPFTEKRQFAPLGIILHFSNVIRIVILKSEKDYKDLLLPLEKSPTKEDPDEFVMLAYNDRVKGVVVCTEEFISFSHVPKDKSKTPSDSIGGKDKVFIGHGRDLKEALELQKYLKDDLKVDALMFEDLKKKSGCKTIIELLDYFKENVGYAFIIFTPDDYGCLCEEFDELTNRLYRDKKKSRTEVINEICGVLKKRARENVVFELGLFIGAIPRDKVCYLLQKDVTATPSNMDGVLHEPFDESVSDTFIAITEKLKNTGLLQKKET